jgi:hypothetical protein
MPQVLVAIAAGMLVGLLFAGPATALCEATPPVGPADGQARVCLVESSVEGDPPSYSHRTDTLINSHVGWYDPQNLYVLADGDVSWHDVASCFDTSCQTLRATYASQQLLACAQPGCVQAHGGASQLAGAGPGYEYQGTFVGGGAAVGTTYVNVAYFQSGFDGQCHEYAEVESSGGRIDVVPSQPCTYVVPYVELPPL